MDGWDTSRFAISRAASVVVDERPRTRRLPPTLTSRPPFPQRGMSSTAFPARSGRSMTTPRGGANRLTPRKPLMPFTTDGQLTNEHEAMLLADDAVDRSASVHDLQRDRPEVAQLDRGHLRQVPLRESSMILSWLAGGLTQRVRVLRIARSASEIAWPSFAALCA